MNWKLVGLETGGGDGMELDSFIEGGEEKEWYEVGRAWMQRTRTKLTIM